MEIHKSKTVKSSQLKRQCNYILTPNQSLLLDPERSVQVRHLEVDHIDVTGPKRRLHADILVHVKVNVLLSHGKEAAEEPLPQHGPRLLLLLQLLLARSGRNGRGDGSSAQSDETWRLRVESTTVWIRSFRQAEHRHLLGHAEQWASGARKTQTKKNKDDR